MHQRCNGSVVKRTLDALTVEDARHAARALLADSEARCAPAAVPTVRTFASAFLADSAERWKPATRHAHADRMNRFILPTFSDWRVDAIDAKDVCNWFDDLSAASAGTANRALAVLSSMMPHADPLGLRREEPTRARGCDGARRDRGTFCSARRHGSCERPRRKGVRQVGVSRQG